MKDKFFWADALADRIIKERGKKSEYVCAAGIGVSGTLHIGNFRDVITSEMIVRALKDRGKRVKLIYSWDDYDRFRKVPGNIPKSYKKYIGMPVSDFPSPYDKSMKYAEYFEKRFEEEVAKVGMKPLFISQSMMNKKCKYASLIKIAIDRREDIMNILNKYRREPLRKDWYPITIYCEKCNKDFTKVLGVEEYIIEYECTCGHKGKFDFRKKGIVKAKWRVDWPLRWKYEKVDFEPGGNDLMVQGGSFKTGEEIARGVFDTNPPFYVFYDWIGIKGGKEFSGSSGNALTISDVLEIYTPEVLRYLFVGTKPKSPFSISFDNDVIKIYEDFDRLEEKYFSKKANGKEKREYEMSVLNIPKKRPKRTPFRHLTTLVQINDINGLNSSDKMRVEKVKNWLEKYAPKDMKFEIQEKIHEKFSIKEREALTELRKILTKKTYKKEKELHDKFYEICEKIGMDNKHFFKISYNAIIRKEKGPKLAHLIISIGQAKIIKLLKTID